MALGVEARGLDVSVLLGPGVNMKRSPLCGRNFEYFSEDPTLAGELAAAMVEGVQSQGVGTSVKHLAANNQETDRMTVSADVDERTLREIYLPAFERVVTRAQPWTVMCPYNRINGVHASEDPWLLTTVLRDQWGFTGLVVSDWGAVNRRDAGVAAGLDLEMPSSSGAGTQVVLDAVRAGTLAEADVDRAAGRVLQLVDRALRGQDVPVGPVDVEAHHALAHEAALAGAVLLKNEDGILPLAADGGTVAVIGDLARDPRYQGAGSSQVNPTRLDDALSALRSALDGPREVAFAPGYVTESAAADGALVEEAVRVAADADVTVLFLGLPASWESEGYDRDTIDLPPAQVDLLQAVAGVTDRIVVVLANGGMVAVEPWQTHALAVLEGWLLGQAGGSAVVDLLLGTANPSGRLAETIPLRHEDTPAVGGFPGEHGHVRYGEGLLIGYRWYDARALPVAYPFGHGLSYTTFRYDGLVAEVVQDGRPTPDGAADGSEPDIRVELRFTVTNTGERTGTETAQVYVSDPVAEAYRPPQELRAFARVELEPGATQEATLILDRRAFAFWHTGLGRWAVEGGAFGIAVGASSRDLRLGARVELPGDDLTPPLTAESTAEVWFAHPQGGPWLREALNGNDFEKVLADPRNGQMMRAIPLVRLSRMPGFPVGEERVREAVTRYAARRTPPAERRAVAY